MAMDPTFAKLATVIVVGSVAKALFRTPDPVVHNHYPEPAQDTDRVADAKTRLGVND